MDNAEFLSLLASRLGCSTENAFELTRSFIDSMTTELDKGAVITISEFGEFQVVKEEEYVTENPVTKESILVPPKLTPQFMPADKLKQDLHID
ncbi:MAG: HU family DNA-binding protein [Bacteroidales bacterium]|nr:HU family DNA-binding protein [Bacteroidales bacterium]